MTKYTHAFIKIKPCGCVPAIELDLQGDENIDETVKILGTWAIEGNSVQRIPIEEARERFGTKCEEHSDE